MDAIRPLELQNPTPSRLTHPLWLVLLFAFSLALRLSAPNDFFEGDQNKQVGYVMDLLHHGHWATQFEVDGLIATKPPLYNWLAACACRLFDTTAAWAIKLPALLAGGLLLCLLYQLTRHYLGQPAAFFACLACIASHHFTKLIWFARTDMLMTATLFAAIYVYVCSRSAWWKASLVGGVLGLSFLAKGPVGPCLFGIFLLVDFAVKRQRPTLADLRVAAPGMAIFAMIVGVWLLFVLRLPAFEESVLHNELARRLPGSTTKTKPFFYYVSHLFTRIAPWSLLGIAAAVMAARQPERWKQIRLPVYWAAAYFLFFSLIPSKRHDLLLPVYPPVFMLAGFALQLVVAQIQQPKANWLLPVAGGGLAVGALWVAFQADAVVPLLLAVATIVAGLATLLAARKRQAYAVHLLAVACLCGHGIYYHWANLDARVDYTTFATFIDRVKTETAEAPVLVYHAHPLVSYELGQHEEFPDPRDLLDRRPTWLIAPSPEVPIIQSWTGWELEPLHSFDFHGQREIDATLYRIQRTPLVTVQRDAAETDAQKRN